MVISEDYIKNPLFNIVQWYKKQVHKQVDQIQDVFFDEEWENLGLDLIENGHQTDTVPEDMADLLRIMNARTRLQIESTPTSLRVLELNSQQVEAGTFPALSCNNV